jgi:hypothetical protein
MTDANDKFACTVRITVRLRPDEYDALFRHVCVRGCTMSKYFRESAAKAMREDHPEDVREPTRSPIVAANAGRPASTSSQRT